MNARTWKVTPLNGDLVIDGIASWFGGANDPDDDGSTASGINTKANPDILGCALPFAVSNGKNVPSCVGSPVPTMPYKTTFVKVVTASAVLYLPVIDCGPALGENRPFDLTQAAFVLLGGNIKTGLMPVQGTIIGGAKYLAGGAA